MCVELSRASLSADLQFLLADRESKRSGRNVNGQSRISHNLARFVRQFKGAVAGLQTCVKGLVKTVGTLVQSYNTLVIALQHHSTTFLKQRGIKVAIMMLPRFFGHL